jgi:hypothetical protein
VTDSDLAAASSLFDEIKAQAAVEAVQEPEVKPEAVSVGNGSQGVASDDPKMHKSQGKRDFPRDSMKDQWAKRDSNPRHLLCKKNQKRHRIAIFLGKSDVSASIPTCKC